MTDTLASLGIKSQVDVDSSSFARVMLVAPAKSGKTTALATAPKPLFINCDSASSLVPARRIHSDAEFGTLDCYSAVRATWKKQVGVAERAVKAGLARSVIVDTVTLLQKNLLAEMTAAGLSGFDKWNALEAELLAGINKLAALPAHLFLTFHMLPGSKEEGTGIAPVISGAAKSLIPAMIDDHVYLAIDPTKPEGQQREFWLGPQKSWGFSGRNIKRTVAVPANVPALFEELGFKL